MKIQVERNICDICGVNEAHTSNGVPITCEYCDKELCKDCIVIIKLVFKEIGTNFNITPSQNIIICKDCLSQKVFSIKVESI